MDPPLITLTTDFGLADSYVAQVKGAILGICPAARLVDVTHTVPPQDVWAAATILDDVIDAFPGGTLHVAVVDPGVGTGRWLIGVELEDQRFLAPDNGLLTFVLERRAVQRVHRLAEPRFWRQPVSATFHGRDILAPVAAHWACGVDLAEFGPAVDADLLVRLAPGAVRREGSAIVGEVVRADSFGNLVTNINEGDIPEAVRDRVIVQLGGVQITGIDRCYGERPPGATMALVGSSGRLEIAVHGGSAAQTLGAGPGAEVRVDGLS